MQHHSQPQESMSSMERRQPRNSAFTKIRNFTLLTIASAFLFVWIATAATHSDPVNASYSSPARTAAVERAPRHQKPEFDRHQFLKRLTEEVGMAHQETERFAQAEIGKLVWPIRHRATSAYIPWITSFTTGVKLRALQAADSWDKNIDFLLGYNLPRHRRDVKLVREKYDELVISPAQMGQKIRGLHRRVQNQHRKALTNRLDELYAEFELEDKQHALRQMFPAGEVPKSGGLASLDPTLFQSMAESSPSAMRGVGTRISQMRAIGGRALSLLPEAGALDPTNLNASDLVLASMYGAMFKDFAASMIAPFMSAIGGASLATLPAAIAVDPVTASVAAGLLISWFVVEHMESKKSGTETLHHLFNTQFSQLRRNLLDHPDLGVMAAVTKLDAAFLTAAQEAPFASPAARTHLSSTASRS